MFKWVVDFCKLDLNLFVNLLIGGSGKWMCGESKMGFFFFNDSVVVGSID